METHSPPFLVYYYRREDLNEEMMGDTDGEEDALAEEEESSDEDEMSCSAFFALDVPELHQCIQDDATFDHVKSVIQSNPSAIHAEDYNGNNVLHAYVEKKMSSAAGNDTATATTTDLQIFALLVEAAPQNLFKCNKNKHPPLVFLFKSSRSSEQDLWPKSLLTLQTLEIALAKCSVAARLQDYQGNTLLHHVCSVSVPRREQAEARWVYQSMIKLLVEAFPEAVTVPNQDGRLPVHLNLINDPCVELVRYLVEVNPFTLYSKCELGRVALHWACESSCLLKGEVSTKKWQELLCNRLEVIRYIADKCPESARAKDEDGQLPICLVLITLCCDDSKPYENELADVMFNLLDCGLFSVSRRGISTSLSPKAHMEADEDEHDLSEILVAAGCATWVPFEVMEVIITKRSASQLNGDGLLPIHGLLWNCKSFSPFFWNVLDLLVRACPESLVMIANDWTFSPIDMVIDRVCSQQQNWKVDSLRFKAVCQIGGPRAFGTIIDQERNLLPLHVAATRSLMTVDLMKCIIEANPSALNARTSHEQLPVDIALSHGLSAEVVELLQPVNAD